MMPPPVSNSSKVVGSGTLRELPPPPPGRGGRNAPAMALMGKNEINAATTSMRKALSIFFIISPFHTRVANKRLPLSPYFF